MSDELFVGNTRSSVGIPPHLSPLRTVRLGDVAHDIHGKKLDGYMSMFISRSEAGAYDRIMMARFSAVTSGCNCAELAQDGRRCERHTV